MAHTDRRPMYVTQVTPINHQNKYSNKQKPGTRPRVARAPGAHRPRHGRHRCVSRRVVTSSACDPSRCANPFHTHTNIHPDRCIRCRNPPNHPLKPSPPTQIPNNPTGETLWVFGGRMGIQMQEGPLDDLWAFDTAAKYVLSFPVVCECVMENLSVCTPAGGGRNIHKQTKSNRANQPPQKTGRGPA